MRSLRENVEGFVDLGLVITIGISFVALIVVAYIIYTLRDSFGLLATPTVASSSAYNTSYYAQNATRATFGNISVGFDNAIALILVAITIFILAIAISALLIIRSR